MLSTTFHTDHSFYSICSKCQFILQSAHPPKATYCVKGHKRREISVTIREGLHVREISRRGFLLRVLFLKM